MWNKPHGAIVFRSAGTLYRLKRRQAVPSHPFLPGCEEEHVDNLRTGPNFHHSSTGNRTWASLVLAVPVIFWLVANACGGTSQSGSSTPHSTIDPGASATSVRPPSLRSFPCKEWPEACEMRQRLEQATLSRDQKALLALWLPVTVECTQPLVGVDAPTELCEGAEAGERRTGYLLGNESRAVAMPASAVTGLPPEADAGTFRAATMGCPAEGGQLDCSRHFIVVFTWHRPDGVRFLWLYDCDAVQGVVRMLRALMHGEGVTSVLVAGGDTGVHPLLPDGFTFLAVE